MPRVSEIEDDGGDPILKDVFAREREIFGGLLNPTKVFAHCPPIMKAFARPCSAAGRMSMAMPSTATSWLAEKALIANATAVSSVS